MTSKWETGKLSDVAVWKSGGTPRSGASEFYENGTHCWAVIKDVQNKDLWETNTRITDSALGPAKGLAPTGSVLVTMYGSIGRSAIARVPVATNQAILWGVPNPGFLSEFIAIWIQANETTLDSMGRGATQRNINGRMVKDFPIPLIPLPEQRRIVDLIGALDDAIEAAEETQSNLESFYLQYCRRSVSVEGDVELEKLGHLIESIKTGKKDTSASDGLIPVFGANGLVGYCKTPNMPAETIVLGRVGAKCGAVHHPGERIWATDNTLCVQASTGVPNRYLYHVLKGLDLNKFKSGSGQPLITQKTVLERVVPLRGKRDMDVIASAGDSIESAQDEARSHAASLRRLRTELLTALLSGTHEILASYDSVMELARA